MDSSEYRHKLNEMPRIVAEWLAPHGGIAEKRVLDFGCGDATAALGTALYHAPREVVGVEIQPEEIAACAPNAARELGLARLPANLRLECIDPGQSLSFLGAFDVVYSWSVFEHVSQDMLEVAMQSLYDALRPDGLFFLQVTPLYYSAWGSHLRPWVPIAWGHLRLQDDHYERRFHSAPDAPAHAWQTYRTLNRATAPELIGLAEQCGFQILRDFRTHDDIEPPDDLAAIYNHEMLRTEQIVLLLRKGA